MKTFKIKVTEKQMWASVYTIPAKTEQEAIDLYANELAGNIEPDESFIVPDLEESIVAWKD